MRASKQGMRKRRNRVPASREGWPEGVGGEVAAGAVDATEVACHGHPAGDVHVSSAVPAAAMPTGIQRGELVSAKDFWFGQFLRCSHHRDEANEQSNTHKFLSHS